MKMSGFSLIAALVAADPKPLSRSFPSRLRRHVNDPRVNGGNKTYERKVLPAELSRNTAMLTWKSSADGGVCLVYLVGTSHISKQSYQQVKAVIEFVKPQAVFLEFEVSIGGELRVAYEEATKTGAHIHVYVGGRRLLIYIGAN